MLACCLLLWLAAEGGDSSASAKERLAPFNEFIGAWRATGEPEIGTPAEKQRGFWKETIQWGWSFKKGDTAVVFEIKNGKHFRGGEIRPAAKPGQFELKLLPKDAAAEPLTFLGKLTNNQRTLVAERVDEATKESQRFTLGLVGEIRFTYRLEKKAAGRSQFQKTFLVAATREGESLAGQPRNTQPECIVSGGLGTMTVSYKGVTYYVCCTGCRDAFNEDPEKYIKEAEEKKRKGKPGA